MVRCSGPPTMVTLLHSRYFIYLSVLTCHLLLINHLHHLCHYHHSYYCYAYSHTCTIVLRLFWIWSGTTRVSQYQKGKAIKVQEAQLLLGWLTVLPHNVNPNPKPITN